MDRIRSMAQEVAHMSTETGCYRLLNDMRDTTIDVSAADLYDSPKIMEQAHIPHSSRRALVVPDSFEESVFLEKITRHRDQDLKIFTDIDAARRFLAAP